jgi:hypothetical protein
VKALILLFLLCALLVGVAEAQQPGGVPWWVVASGSGDSASAHYGIRGTVGQAGTGDSSGSVYMARWGYWRMDPIKIIDTLEAGAIQMQQDVTYGDLFKAFSFLIVSAASLARWGVNVWLNR